MRQFPLAARAVAVLLVCGAAIACGGSNSSTPTAPTPTPAASPAPTPAPAPAPALPQLAGTWNGTFEMTQDNQRVFITITTTLTQTNRNVSGTWRSTTAGVNDNGDFTGVINGDGAAASVSGTVNIIHETATGTGRCRARSTVSSENAVTASSLRLIGPNIQLLDCNGNVRGLVWILGR